MNIEPTSFTPPTWRGISEATPKAAPRPVARTPIPVQSPAAISYRVDDSTDRVVISIIDPETGSVIRQIPSEEMLEFFHRMNVAMQKLFNTTI